MAMRYELFNKQDFCDPTFYYGRACRNVIARNMIGDPDFIRYRKNYFNTIDNLIHPLIELNESEIDISDEMINANQILTSDEFIDKSTEKVSKITDILTQIKTQSLGSFGQSLVQPIKDANKAISDQLKKLPEILDDMKTQLNNGFIKPSTIHLYSALDKLYKSTLDGASSPATSTGSISPISKNSFQPTFSPNIPIGL
jgi:hypothetical protein